VGKGVLVACGLHLLQVLIVPLIASIVPEVEHRLRGSPRGGEDLGLDGLVFSLAAFSITQFLYLGPAIWRYRRRGLNQVVKGILIVAGITFLLNSGCDLMLFGRH